MTPASWILGETIDALRAARTAGVPVSRLVADLRRGGMDLRDVVLHMEAAFLLTARGSVALLPKDDAGEPDPGVMDAYVGPQVDAARHLWQGAPPYPDLPQRRDRYAFAAMAQRHGLVLVVCVPAAFAADGHEPAEYRLHGVYDAESGANAWTCTRAERWRAELNLRLGAERIRRGPCDTRAAHPASAGGEASGTPQPPVLFFLPDGTVELRTDAAGMERYYRYLGIDWDACYPSTARAPADMHYEADQDGEERE